MISILFIDSRVVDYQSLLTGLSGDVEVHLIVAERDGVAQMAQILNGRSGLDSIQIISHGSVGALYLGSTVLDNNNLSGYADSLARIGTSLTDSGDILLYGCNVGQGVDGKAFIATLAGITGADVAASDDATGSALLNGNWILEESVGSIDAGGLQGVGFTGLLASDITVGFPSNNTTITEGDSGTKQLNLTVNLWFDDGANTTIRIDNTGDTVAEMQIILSSTGLGLLAAHFIL